MQNSSEQLRLITLYVDFTRFPWQQNYQVNAAQGIVVQQFGYDMTQTNIKYQVISLSSKHILQSVCINKIICSIISQTFHCSFRYWYGQTLNSQLTPVYITKNFVCLYFQAVQFQYIYASLLQFNASWFSSCGHVDLTVIFIMCGYCIKFQQIRRKCYYIYVVQNIKDAGVRNI
ncbi:Hypothetical_protein [Hexamita inflata]|uniref:Hypothetical_protein n=1 Tax=Hexamita inflata TaxID=28002 RepID=A0AA86UF92_9EUKA|nr:Hypothetical protein HINF_LOCUS43500 [Hexamita inflata]CAI9955858.1 Hypothetical protein HINF_LOCUS43503 [Hexamita inflata]